MGESVKRARHATSRYQDIEEQVVDEVQRACARGACAHGACAQGAGAQGVDLRSVATWISVNDKRVIAAESLDADRIVGEPLPELLSASGVLEPMTDYKWAAAAERLFSEARRGDDRWEDRAWELLADVGETETASPMLSYEPMYRDLAEIRLVADRADALVWLRRALVHNLVFNRGDDVRFALIDLASAHLQLGQLDRGLSMLAALISDDPADPWVYRFMATGFGVLGLVELGVAGARRGLALLDATDDPEELHDELLMAEFDLLASPKRGREAEVSQDVLVEVREALALDFDAGARRDPEALCRALVPDLDEIPVKRRLRLADLPPAVRNLVT